MTERHVIELPCVWDAANRKKDRSLSLRLTTAKEITNGEFAEIDKMVGTNGYFLFAANRFSDADIPTDDAPNDNKKPSQRLRACLFLLWKQEDNGQAEDFDAFYRRNLEQLIDWVKEKLE